jgi:hypothetical protein
MKTWIFQGNPDRFDVDEYLRSVIDIYWTVSWKTHQKQVELGDHVYIWRARGRSASVPGIVGFGYINEPCRAKSEIAETRRLSDDLWTDGATEIGEVKAGIHLDEVRLTPSEGMLTAAQIRMDAVLSRMRIVTVRTGTNFPVSLDQAERLLDLWTAGQSTEATDFGGTRYSGAEGRSVYRIHRSRERDPRLTAEAKRLFRARKGQLFCEVCGFSFSETYGELGREFIESHHLKPLSEVKPGEQTDVDDLLMVCSNCHSMLHRGDPSENLALLRKMFHMGA